MVRIRSPTPLGGGLYLYSFLNAQRAWGHVRKFAKVLEGIDHYPKKPSKTIHFRRN